MPREYDYFCAITTRQVIPGPGVAPFALQIAICVKLSGRFQNNAGLAEALGLVSLNDVRAMVPIPIVEIERSYSAAARRGVLGNVGFQIVPVDDANVDPSIGAPYKSTLVYSTGVWAQDAAHTIQDHRWVFGIDPEHRYKIVLGRIVENKSKRTTPTFT